MKSKYARRKSTKDEARQFMLRCASRVVNILEDIDNRAMASDGCVPRTRLEATDIELRRLYLACQGIQKSYRMLVKLKTEAGG